MGHYVSEDSSFISKVSIIFCLLLAGYEMYFGLTQGVQGYVTKQWPSVMGTVVDIRSVQSPGLAYGRTSQAIRVVFPKVNYEYTVQGQIYRGDRIQFGMQFSQRGMLEKYTTGNKVPVYYQPDNPRQAVLIKGWSVMGILYTVSLVVFFVIVALLVVVFERI